MATDADVRAMTTAPLDADGVPYCDLHEISKMHDDEKDPRFCTCETCGKRYLTPQHVLNGIILGHLEALSVSLRLAARQIDAAEANKLIEEAATRFGLTATP